MKKRYCTIPEVLGLRKWFESRFSDLCKEHDERYEKRDVTKWEADKAFLKGMLKKGKRYAPLVGVTFAFFQTFGQWHWYTED